MKNNKIILLVLNGQENKKFLKETAQNYSFILATDGGADKCLNANILPTKVIGDLDTISKKAKEILKNKLIKIARQDNTDFEKSLQYLKTLKIKQVDIILSNGKRFDFMLSNFLVAFNYIKYFKIRFLFPKETIYILDRGAKFTCKTNTRVSLIPLEEIKHISTKNLLYQLNNDTLEFSQRGISNKSIANNFEVIFKKGKILISIAN